MFVAVSSFPSCSRINETIAQMPTHHVFSLWLASCGICQQPKQPTRFLYALQHDRNKPDKRTNAHGDGGEYTTLFEDATYMWGSWLFGHITSKCLALWSSQKSRNSFYPWQEWFERPLCLASTIQITAQNCFRLASYLWQQKFFPPVKTKVISSFHELWSEASTLIDRRSFKDPNHNKKMSPYAISCALSKHIYKRARRVPIRDLR